MRELRSFNELAGLAVQHGATDIHLASGLPPLFRVRGKLIASEFEWQTPESIERIIFYFFEWERRPKLPVDDSPLFSFPENLPETVHSEGRISDPFGDPFGDPFADLPPYQEPELGLSLNFGYDYRECPIYQNYLREGQVCVASHIDGVGHFRFALYRERGALHAAVRLHPWRPSSLVMLGWPEHIIPEVGLWTVLGEGRTTVLASLVQYQLQIGRPVHLFEQRSEYLFPEAATQLALGHDPNAWSRAIKSLLDELDASAEKQLTVVVIDELRHEFQYQLAVELLQRNCLLLAGHTGSHFGSLRSEVRAHLQAQNSDESRLLLFASHIGIVVQRLVPMARGFGQIGAFCVYTSEASDRSQTLYMGPTCKLSLEDSLACLVKGRLVSTEDALKACQRPDILLEKLASP